MTINLKAKEGYRFRASTVLLFHSASVNFYVSRRSVATQNSRSLR